MLKGEFNKTNIKRIVKSGFFNFIRDNTVSFASVAVMTITLIVIGMLSLGSAILETSLTELRDKIDINVTFVTTADEQDILDIKHSLESLPEVSLVTYVSKEEALQDFKERHQSDPTILAALDELGSNPLGAVLNIKAREPSQYETVAQFLEGDGTLSSTGVAIIDNVNYFQNKVAIDRLTAIIDSADRLGFLLTIALAVISILIAFNTIRLTIYIARDEINVMRLVGASTTYIQGPFVVLGILYGLVAGIITLLIFLPITYWVGSSTETFLAGFNLFSYYIANFPEMFMIIIGSGIVIGALSSLLAIRKHLTI